MINNPKKKLNLFFMVLKQIFFLPVLTLVAAKNTHNLARVLSSGSTKEMKHSVLGTRHPQFDCNNTFVCFEQSKNNFSWYARSQNEAYEPLAHVLNKSCLRLASRYTLGAPLAYQAIDQSFTQHNDYQNRSNQKKLNFINNHGILLPDFSVNKMLEKFKEKNPAFFCHMMTLFFDYVERAYEALDRGFVPEDFSEEAFRIFHFLSYHLDCRELMVWALYPLLSDLQKKSSSASSQESLIIIERITCLMHNAYDKKPYDQLDSFLYDDHDKKN